MAKTTDRPGGLFLFDLLWSDGRHLSGKTFSATAGAIQQVITPGDGIEVSGYIENRGIDPLRLAREKGPEGIIAKRKRSTEKPTSPLRLSSKI